MPELFPLSQALRNELESHARQFKRDARWTRPRFATGHLIAHEDPKSRAKNWSTITRIVRLSDGRRIYLVYRYPLSFLHALLDNAIRVLCGRRSWKTLTRRAWQPTFELKSRIRVYPMSVRGVVAMDYIPNYNLWDVLVNGFGGLGTQRTFAALRDIVDQVNDMHRHGQTWADLIVNNLLVRSDTGVGVICDTEVNYLPWVEARARKMFDWRDLIFSVAGAWGQRLGMPEIIVRLIVSSIEDRDIQRELIMFSQDRHCFGDFTFWQHVWFAAFGGQLSCSRENYRLIRRTIAEMTVITDSI